MRVDKVCILGGSGFVGRHILDRLSAGEADVQTLLLTRNRAGNQHLAKDASVQVEQANVYDEEALAGRFAGQDAVINLVGILNEGGEGSFRRAHVDLPDKVARACQQAGVRQLLHMSALGADLEGPSRYQASKAEGEALVHRAASDDFRVTSFQPSVIFGPQDSFLNRFAGLLRIPGPFPLPTPDARFSPVYVEDVAKAFVHCLGREDASGQRYQLCGPGTYTLRELIAYVANTMGKPNKPILPLPDALSKLQGRALGLIPGKPYSYDNYLSATVDNVCSHNALPDLGIEPTALETAVPGYLGSGK